MFFNASWLSADTETIARRVIDPLQSEHVRVVLVLLDTQTPTQPYFTAFLRAAALRSYHGANVQLVALQFVDRLLVAPEFMPPLSTQVARNLIFPQPALPSSSAAYQRLVQSWQTSRLTSASAASPPLVAAYAFDAVQLVAAAIKSLKAPSLAYQSAIFMSALRSASLSSQIAATGALAFPPSSNTLANDRVQLAAAWSLLSIQPVAPPPGSGSGVTLQTLGSTDALSGYVPAANPLSWGGGASQPPMSCPPGSVGSLTTRNSLVFTLCNPCPNGTFAPDYSTTCRPCPDPSRQWCFLGASMPINQTQPLFQRYGQEFPINEGSLTDPIELEQLNLSTMWLLLISVIIASLFGVSIAFCPRHLQFIQIEWWKLIDVYGTEHPTEIGQPIVKKSTGIGGFFTFISILISLLVGAYLSAVYVVDAFNVYLVLEVGTALMLKGDAPITPFGLDISFLLSDNLVMCPRVCSSSTYTASLSGQFTCHAETAAAICHVRFRGDASSSASLLPPLFSFDIKYPNARLQGVYISITSVEWLGQLYGLNSTLRASEGMVYFGLQPMVFNITMMPFRFEALPAVRASVAPQVAMGYIPLLASTQNASMMGVQAWRSNDLLAQGAGVRVQLNFERPQQVARFFTLNKTSFMDFFTIWCCLIFTGINLFLNLVRYVIEWTSFRWRRRRDELIAEEMRKREQIEKDIARAREIARLVKAGKLPPEAALDPESVQLEMDEKEADDEDDDGKSSSTGVGKKTAEQQAREAAAAADDRMLQMREGLARYLDETLPPPPKPSEQEIPTQRLLGLLFDVAQPVMITQVLWSSVGSFILFNFEIQRIFHISIPIKPTLTPDVCFAWCSY